MLPKSRGFTIEGLLVRGCVWVCMGGCILGTLTFLCFVVLLAGSCLKREEKSGVEGRGVSHTVCMYVCM